MSNVITLPTRHPPEETDSFYTVRKIGRYYGFCLITPVGREEIKTCLSKFHDRDAAIRYAKAFVAERSTLPLKIRGKEI